jgi:hypothetical protein
MSNISQAERWLHDRALGKDTFNFAIELKQDIAGPGNPPIIGAVGTFHLPEVGYSRLSTEYFVGRDMY